MQRRTSRTCARGARWLVAAAVLVGLGTAAEPARAIDPADLPPAPGGRGVLSSDPGPRHSHWRDTGGRTFLSAVFDVGMIYARPSLAVGYGEPHYSWLGLETSSGIARSGGTEYIGLRGALPFLHARAGLRYHFPFDQYYLTPQPFYSRDDLEIELHGLSNYLAIETELSTIIPMPGGRLIAVGTGYMIMGTPPDLMLYEDALKVVMEPPVLWRARLGYLASIGWGDHHEDMLRIGAAAEVIHSPDRQAVTVRVGPLLAVALTCHLEAIGSAMIAAASPDRLGLRGGDFGEIGLRYRWATGDPAPGFP